MIPPCGWAEIILKRLAANPLQGMERADLHEWLSELVEEIQNDAQPVHGNA